MQPSQIKRRGNILIAVLWIITTMAVLVLGLSYEARSDMERTRLNRDRVRAYWLSRGALERVKYEYAVIRQAPAEEQTSNASYFHFEFEGGYAECQVRTNSALMSVNSTDAKLWRQLLKLYPGLEEGSTELEEVVDAILDWRDADNLERVNGVESDYYENLTPPYPARNGPFYSVDEILLVKGISEQMFYGSPQFPGLTELLTIGRQNIARFDINTCPKGILIAFLEMEPEQADEFIRLRRDQYFKDINEALQVMSINDPAKLAEFFLSIRGSTVSIKITACVNNSPARHTLEETVQYMGGGKFYRNISHKDFSLDHVDEIIEEEVE